MVLDVDLGEAGRGSSTNLRPSVYRLTCACGKVQAIPVRIRVYPLLLAATSPKSTFCMIMHNGEIRRFGGGREGAFDHSPHKFRHGNAVYSLKMARDIAALEAVRQNLMHQNLTVTDGA